MQNQTTFPVDLKNDKFFHELLEELKKDQIFVKFFQEKLRYRPEEFSELFNSVYCNYISSFEERTILNDQLHLVKQKIHFEDNDPTLERLFIDFKRQTPFEKGKRSFEDVEPGYTESMVKAWNEMNKSNKKGIDLIKHIHLHAASVGGDRERDASIAGNIRNNEGVRFGIPLSIINMEGFLETYIICKELGLRQLIVVENSKILCTDTPTGILYENIEQKLSEIQSEYEKRLIEAADDNQKLYAIVRYIKKLEILHPFIDANCRTFCMLLLNHELKNNGFGLTILDDPNDFDGLSLKELVIQVKKGMQNVLSFVENVDSYETYIIYKDKKELANKNSYNFNDKRNIIKQLQKYYEKTTCEEDIHNEISKKPKPKI